MVISAPQVLLPDGLTSGAAVVVEDGRIASIDTGAADVALPEGILAPGLIDLQINGGFGIDFADAEPEAWRAVMRRLPETGVTACLPTLITAPLDEIVDGLERARTAIGGDGARILGVHVEGPFLSPERHGAHDPGQFCDPTPERLDALLRPGTLALLTLAPERPGALGAIARLVAEGVVASVGHSDATAAVVAAAADAGARMVTHLFNAQRGIHHREPGVAGQALADPRLVSGLILDGHHVSDAVAGIALRAAPGRIALVSDATGAAESEIPAAKPPRHADGRLAGANLRLDAAVARAVTVGASPAAALEAASRVPADVLGHPDLGRIARGAVADLVWLGPDFRTRATWIGGELVRCSAPIATASSRRPSSPPTRRGSRRTHL